MALHRDERPPRDGPYAAALGVADGLHRGHRAILSAAAEAAPGAKPLLVTFHPHPRTVLSGSPIPLLTPPRHQARLAEALAGADVWAIPFAREVADLGPAEFLDSYLGPLSPEAVAVGYDFRFGRDRGGEAADLERWCERSGVEARVVERVDLGGEPVKSSRVRRAVEAGDLEAAESLLDRTFSVSGPVVPGAGRGRGLGVPTANVALHPDQCLPPEGVWAGRGVTAGGRWPAAVHLGPAATFGETERRLEAHLIGFSGDLLGEVVEVEFARKLRDTVEFADKEELRRQLERDLQAARGDGGER